MREIIRSTQKLMKYIIVVIIASFFFSHIITIGYTAPTGIFSGLYIKYTHSDSFHIGETQDTIIRFSKISDEVYHVTWTFSEGTLGLATGGISSWDENLNTRIVSNMVLPGPSEGSHTWTRILTNVTLNDTVKIFIFTGGDQNFNVSSELNWTFNGIGEVGIWELEDSNGSVVWYEKSTGIFLNGTFHYSGFWKKAEFVSTNIFPVPGIPGYNILFLITLTSIIGVIIIKHRSRKE
ncbi:MAG: Loki-CTERM sorting domain-containing protein [Promethearchaeota archaeon]|jgi:hypothetical protein